MELNRNVSTAVNILFVEDDTFTKELLQVLILKKFPDVAMRLAGNGESGVRLCGEHPFDIVITDINMPDMDGIQMAEQIKLIKPGMKFIVLSGYSEQYYLDKLSEIGITDYMLKPVDTNKLFLIIGKFIDQVRLERRDHAMLN